MKHYVIITDGKITTYFGGPQNKDEHPGVEKVSGSDQVYVDFYNSLNDADRGGIPQPE